MDSHVVRMHMGVMPLQFRKGQLYWDLGSDIYKTKVLAGDRHVREASDLRVVLRSEEYPVARTNLPYQIRPLVPECLFYGLRLLHLCTFRRLQRFGTWFGAPYYRVQPGPGKVSCTVA